MPVRVRIEAFSFELTHAVRLRRGCPLLPMRDRTASPAPGLHSSQGSYGSHNCAARLCRSGSFTVDMGLKASSSMARRQAFFFIFDMWCSSQSFCRMRPRHFMILTRRGLAHGSHGSPVSRQARFCPVRSKVRSWLADVLWEAGLAARNQHLSRSHPKPPTSFWVSRWRALPASCTAARACSGCASLCFGSSVGQ